MKILMRCIFYITYQFLVPITLPEKIYKVTFFLARDIETVTFSVITGIIRVKLNSLFYYHASEDRPKGPKHVRLYI
jgi:hypothetical protein